MYFLILFTIFNVAVSQPVSSIVYGQGGSFTSNTANNGGVTANSLNTPIGVYVDSSKNLYLADAANNRALFYLSGSTTATRVYGQLGSFTSNTANNGGVTANSLSGPTDILLDVSGNVYIADSQNHRVLFYPGGSTTATRVYGQLGSFTSNTASNGGLNANSLDNPTSVTTDSTGNLYIADTSNNRVLYYISGSTTATRVYGQLGNFNNKAFTPITADRLKSPTDVAVDASNNVYIADSGYSRILFYTAGSTTATRVYGQLGSFTSGDGSNPGGVSSRSLSRSTGVGLFSNFVFISDLGNNRVLRFTVPSNSADKVFGQSSMGALLPNSPSLSASSLDTPYQTTVDSSGGLYVSDGGNNRVVYYPSSTMTTTSTTTAPGGSTAVCFHISTMITYKDKTYTYDQLNSGEEPECRIPHLISSSGIVLKVRCPSEKDSSGDLETDHELILTPDHLVMVKSGFNGHVFMEAGKIKRRFSVYVLSKHGKRDTCKVISNKPKKNVMGDFYFGLNCLESVVYANGIQASTFGRHHSFPAFWMSTVGKLFGIEKASSWGETIVQALSRYGLF